MVIHSTNGGRIVLRNRSYFVTEYFNIVKRAIKVDNKKAINVHNRNVN